jgi:hypothetical protein
MVDLILCLAVVLLFASMFSFFPVERILLFGGIASVLFSVFWFAWIRPVYKVVISDGKITGPSPSGRRISFPLRKMDHRKILLRTRKQKLIGYRDLYSLDGMKIRLVHRFLGKAALCDILEIVEKYPFRETAGGVS